MIQWGILGAGNIARRFAESLKHEGDSVLSAISGRSREKVEKFALEFSAGRFYTSHEELLEDTEVEAVYLALPHGLHKEWAIRALEAGKAVFCEKPAALSEEEMREIAETARKTGTLFMEAMKPRFVPIFPQIMETARSGEIGEIVRIETSLCVQMAFDFTHPTYHTQPGQGGVLLDEGIYGASWIQDFFGCPKRVRNVAANVKEAIDYYIDAELEFKDGKSARLECAFDRQKEKLAVIYGENGKIVVKDFHRAQEMEVFVNGQEPRKVMVPYVVDDFYGEICHFADCLRRGKTESEVMPLSASVECAQILDGIRESMKLTTHSLEVLQEQEAILRYENTFGSCEALKLGNVVAELAKEYDRGVSVAIIREKDGMILFQYSMDDKTPKNMDYMMGKRRAALQSGHCSLWTYVEHELSGKWQDMFDHMPEYVPSGGAFPIRVQDEWTATLLISGLHEGKDHELAVKALCRVLGKEVPEFPGVAV